MDAPADAGTRPDLTDLFAAEDSPMLGGPLRWLAAAALLVVLVGRLVRRRRRA
ncbi:MAG: hypothetical protein ACKO04_09745 [Actinomycetes bacterium]